MATPFRTSRRVDFADTDMAGIVHFSNFFRFMESAEIEFLHSLGLSVAMPWEGERIGFPRVSAACDYVRPARFEEVLDIAVGILKIGSKSVTYEFDFTRDGDMIAHGQICTCCCRVHRDHQLESIDIPAGIRERLQASQK